MTIIFYLEDNINNVALESTPSSALEGNSFVFRSKEYSDAVVVSENKSKFFAFNL